MARIFISYSRMDEVFARRLAESFSALGVDVWIDVEDIPAGMKWSSAIQEGLRAAELMLVIISPTSMASINVEDEWQYFLDKKKPVIPVRWIPTDVHFQLNRLQYIDFHQQPYDVAFRRLLQELRRKGLVVDGMADDPEETVPVTNPRPPVPIPQPPAPDEYFNRQMQTRSAGLRRSSMLAIGGALAGIIALIAVGALLVSNLSRSNPDATLGATMAVVGDAGLTATAAAEEALTASATPTLTPTATHTQPPPLGYSAANPVLRNADWQRVTQVINGYEMVLVPAGRFVMGAGQQEISYALSLCALDSATCNNLLSDERVQTPITFDAPFWIDRYEVPADGSNMPAALTVEQSAQVCAARGGRLPTEPEWEYAARGPDGLYFPWGNTFDGARVNFCDSNCSANWRDSNWNDGYAQAAPVTAFENGESWVGARNMAGNMWEFTSTQYNPAGFVLDDDDDGDDLSGDPTLKGGGWTWLAMEMRGSTRDNPIQPRTDYYGFRCVLPYTP